MLGQTDSELAFPDFSVPISYTSFAFAHNIFADFPSISITPLYIALVGDFGTFQATFLQKWYSSVYNTDSGFSSGYSLLSEFRQDLPRIG